MSELYPTDAELNALSGTSDPQQEVLYLPIGQSPYYTSFYKMQQRLLNVARRAGDLRVYKDGALTFGVRAGQFMDGPTVRTYGGSAGNALTPGATNTIYLNCDGTLAVSLTGLPDSAQAPHLPLASIAAGAESYEAGAITDLRGLCMYRPTSPATGAMIKTLTDGSNADLLHSHALGGAGIAPGKLFYWDVAMNGSAATFTLKDTATGQPPEQDVQSIIWLIDTSADSGATLQAAVNGLSKSFGMGQGQASVSSWPGEGSPSETWGACMYSVPKQFTLEYWYTGIEPLGVEARFVQHDGIFGPVSRWAFNGYVYEG